MTEEDKNQLLLFDEKVKNLLEHDFVKNQHGIQFSPIFKIGNLEPTESQIESLLIRFRFFYMEKEPTNFRRICNILYQNTTKDSQKEVIAFLRKMYDRFLKLGSGFALKINEEPVSPNSNIDLWLNAHYFHSDEEKKKELEELFNQSMGFAKSFFIFEVLNLIKIIVKLNEISQEILI